MKMYVLGRLIRMVKIVDVKVWEIVKRIMFWWYLLFRIVWRYFRVGLFF